MAKIARIYSWDGDDQLIVPGTDPQKILTDAAREIDDDMVILTPLESVRVEWWRTSPCHPNSCGLGPHTVHYERTPGKTRGGFQAAALDITHRDWVTA